MRNTRSDLLVEAEGLIRGRGYSGFSFADLADAVGIRKASIHHHFPTKADLAIALVAAYDERYDAALDAIGAGSPDAIARIEAYGRLYLDGVEQSLGCLCAVLATELPSLPERLRHDIAQFFDKHIDWLQTVLLEGQASGTVRDNVNPASCARMIIATLEGALMMERVLAGAAGFRSVLDALRNGLVP
jgi:TetR/AcrR family transcriptional repressor of nem operon